ncbi:DUF4310 family protein [Serratia ureilytica]
MIILARANSPSIRATPPTGGRDDGRGQLVGPFLGPLIILSAMTASIPIGIGSLLGALLFYIWGKPITMERSRRDDHWGDLPGSHFLRGLRRAPPDAAAPGQSSNAVCMT